MFYHYEPLHYKGIRQLAGGKDGQEAVDLAEALLTCDFSNEGMKDDAEDIFFPFKNELFFVHLFSGVRFSCPLSI